MIAAVSVPPENSMKKIFLLDGYNLFYRCFYAVPPFTGPEGQPVNAVF